MSDTPQLEGQGLAIRKFLESPAAMARILAVSSGDKALADRAVAMACLAVLDDQFGRLAACPPLSVLKCVVRSVELGLTLGDPIRAEAYLIPFDGVCTLMPGYRGLVKLARASGEIKRVVAHPVYRGDHFEAFFGSRQDVVHAPNWDTPRLDQNITHFYAIAWWASGDQEIQVKTKAQVDDVMRGVERKNKGKLPDPWKYAYPEQGRKTMVRYLTKYLPLTPAAERYMHETEAEDLGVDRERVFIDPADALVEASRRSLPQPIARETIDVSGSSSVIEDIASAIAQTKLPHPSAVVAPAVMPGAATADEIDAALFG